VSAVLTSKDDKRVSDGEAARWEVTVGYRVLMLSLSREGSRITQDRCSGRTQWMFRKNSMEFFIRLSDYLYKFYYGYAATNPRSHVLLEYSTIT